MGQCQQDIDEQGDRTIDRAEVEGETGLLLVARYVDGRCSRQCAVEILETGEHRIDIVGGRDDRVGYEPERAMRPRCRADSE